MDKITLLFAIVTFASFAVIAISFAISVAKKTGGGRGDAVVFKLNIDRKDEEKAAELLKSADFPLAFDIVVQHIGTDREDYAVVERKYADKAEALMKGMWPDRMIERSGDYLVFHHGGFYDAIRALIPEEDLIGKDITDVDLSGVSDIGEGAVVRFFRDPASKERQVSVLGLFSAPSQFQLREVQEAVSNSFKNRKVYSPKNKEEIFRAFGSADEIAR